MSACLRRWLVVWMLLVAVPLQGIAAVTACGPLHQRTVGRGAQPVGPAQATVAEIAAVRVAASHAAADAGKAAHARPHGSTHSVGGKERSRCGEHGCARNFDLSGVDGSAPAGGHVSSHVDGHSPASEGNPSASVGAADSVVGHNGSHASADGSPDGSSSCNGCAPCCTGAALTSGFALPLHAEPGVADFPSLNDGHLSAPLRVLERPPRLSV